MGSVKVDSVTVHAFLFVRGDCGSSWRTDALGAICKTTVTIRYSNTLLFIVALYAFLYTN